jgi:hypothetical protein
MSKEERACLFIKEALEISNRRIRAESKKLFIVVALEKLKSLGEGALRWSFFTLNMFMFGIHIIHSE